MGDQPIHTFLGRSRQDADSRASMVKVDQDTRPFGRDTLERIANDLLTVARARAERVPVSASRVHAHQRISRPANSPRINARCVSGSVEVA